MGNNFPDMQLAIIENQNPMVSSTNADHSIQFRQTRDSLNDVDEYRKFLNNAISQFRHTRTYNNYKSFLCSIGLNRCQYLGNVTSDMASVEMNHCILTIFDVAYIITETTLKEHGSITTFELVHMLKEVHKKNMVPLVMMSKTVHQLYHSDDDFYVAPSQIFGKWWELLKTFRAGISVDIAFKIINWLKVAAEKGEMDTMTYFDMSNNIMNWGMVNDNS